MNISSKLDRLRPFAAVSSERMVVVLLLLSGLAIALAPKGLAALVLLLAICAAVNLWARGETFELPFNTATISLFALVVWAGVSVLWTQDMAAAGRKFGQLFGFLLCLPPLWRFAVTNRVFSSRAVQLGLLASFLVSWGIAASVVFFPAELVEGVAALNGTLQERGFSPVQMQNHITVSNRALTVLVPLTFVLFAFFSGRNGYMPRFW